VGIEVKNKEIEEGDQEIKVVMGNSKTKQRPRMGSLSVKRYTFNLGKAYWKQMSPKMWFGEELEDVVRKFINCRYMDKENYELESKLRVLIR